MSRRRDQDRPGRRQGHRPWYGEAVLAALAGGLFGLAIAAVLSLGLAFGYAPMVALERLGVDLSMNALADSDEAGAQGRGQGGFVFVDIDRAACRLFAPAPPGPDGALAAKALTLCEVGKPAPQGLILDFVRAAATSKAAVVVLDIASPDDAASAASRRAGLAASAAGSGPWIIVEAAARPDDDARSFGYFGDPARDTATWPVSGRIRPALMAPATDPTADDGVIRHYPPAGWMDVGEAGDRYLPSAPYLAALLANPRLAGLADCAYFRAAAGCAAPADGAGLWTASRGKTPASPIHYRFKSLSLDPDSRPTAEAELRYRGRYDRYEASDLLKKGGFVLEPKAFAGKTIVLGSSLRSGFDWHATPLGPMSGAEVIINAANSFAEFGVQSDTAPSGAAARAARWFAVFREQALGVISAMLLMTPVWFAVHGLAHFTARRSRRIKFLARLACAAIFVGGLAFVLRFELGHAAEQMRTALTVGHAGPAVDLLGPTLGVGLDGFSVFSSWLTRSLEALLVAIWTFGYSRLRPGAAEGDET